MGTSSTNESETLSSCILAAIKERNNDEAMFVLLSQPSRCRASTTMTTAACPSAVEQTIVTKNVWSTFTWLLHRRLSVAPPCAERGNEKDHGSPTNAPEAASRLRERCDVGVYCNEVFYTCLVESACLFLGVSFCPFRPDDPPMRLERLEQRRRPRHKLYASDIAALLQAALSGHQDSDETSTIATSSRLTASPSSALGEPRKMSDACVAYYMHTSGSTGDPKCVVASRGNLHAYLRRFICSCDGLAVVPKPTCRLFCLSSPFFDPSIGDMLATLCTPHCVFYTCSQESVLNGCVGGLSAAAQPTHVVSTPAIWRTVALESLQSSISTEGGTARPRMKVFLGGERMPQDLIDAWSAEVELFNIYGVTEATIYQSVRRVHTGARAEEVTCGAGVGTRIAIDAEVSRASTENDDGDLCNNGGFGEVVLYGDQVCCGYADEAQSGHDASSPFGVDPITHTRFFRTGDIGKLVASDAEDARPQLVLRGRRDWQIKLNGQRVSIEEVEGTVQRVLEGVVGQCACFCIKGESGSAAASAAPVIGAAAVLLDVPSAQVLEGHACSVAEALQEVLALHLPPFMVPRRWLLRAHGSTLPHTATGKVSRIELARLAWEEMQAQQDANAAPMSSEADSVATRAAAAAEPHDALYATVQSAWERQLGMPVLAHTHYLHAGGDSLGALKLTRAIFLALHDGTADDSIDEYGGLPPPFQPCVLLQHPRLDDYVAVLRRKGKDCGISLLPAASVAPAQTTANPPCRLSSLFREVVAAQCCALAERLLRYGVVDVNGNHTREHRCVTPLHIAVSSCGSTADELAAALRMVTLLLDAGAKPTAVTPDGVTPAHLAAAVSAPLLQRLLVRAPALLHCRDGRQQSLLHFAARSGNVAAVRLLLSTYDLKLDTRDKWQRTPVHWAVLNGHLDVLESMLAHHVAALSSGASSPTPSSSQQRPADTSEDTDVQASSRHKRGRRQGYEIARFARLARKKTHLAYETLCIIAQRTWPGQARMMELCNALSPAVGEEPPTQ